ncbi:hypothetical protein V6N12_028780 [Hibiscus sabdariffa]|uniref:Uncharacterized protein n=1 Tax=Hibiscus sabdariffa TaxID=183260 RepID=A0ABR2F6U3_9ROSI
MVMVESQAKGGDQYCWKLEKMVERTVFQEEWCFGIGLGRIKKAWERVVVVVDDGNDCVAMEGVMECGFWHSNEGLGSWQGMVKELGLISSASGGCQAWGRTDQETMRAADRLNRALGGAGVGTKRLARSRG